MSKRLYEEVLPLQLEYFVGSANNKIDFLREAEELSREKTVINALFKNVTNSILKVTDKFEKPLDTSKGDIRRVVGGKELLATINKMSKNYNDKEKDVTTPVKDWGLNELITLSRKSYMYIANLKGTFQEGYRSNNLFIMTHYKALVANLFALVGEIVAYTVSNQPVSYKSLRVTTLRDFVINCENGSIEAYLRKSKELLESLELDGNKMLYESFDIVQSGVKFVKRLINNMDKNDAIGNFVYQAVDFMKQILNIKQMIWPMIVGNGSLLPKMNDYIGMFKTFLNTDETTSGNTSKIAEQILNNSVRADDRANYYISAENETMYKDIQSNFRTIEKGKPSETIDDFTF